MNLRQGSIRLFRVAGIDLYLHWSWFLVAAYEISGRSQNYSSVAWNVLEYLSLFLIVMMHEFGHALACRQVGGTANRIVLWPLGGVAYVDPPPRPGATLWSIAAGPLVNVALIPVLAGLGVLSRSMNWTATMPNADALLHAVWIIDISLLVFNMLPIYPLDGGQILRSLLWFLMGRGRSLMAATIIGFIGVAGLDRAGGVDAIAVVWCDLGVHPDELLERVKTGSRIIASGKNSASRWIRMSSMQYSAADRKHLGLRAVPKAVRYFPVQCRVPELLYPICSDGMPGLRRKKSHQRVGCSRPWTSPVVA